MAHITGGGLTDNVPRILPQDCRAVFDRSAIEVLPVFKLMQRAGDVPDADMWRTFNMGVGMVLVCSPRDIDAVSSHLASQGEEFTRIGVIESGARGVIYRD